jgi:hypothetical protein
MKPKKISATPESDANRQLVTKVWQDWATGIDPRPEVYVVSLEVARRLEQERDDARRIADKLRKAAWKIAKLYSSSQLEKAKQELEDLL